MQSAALGLVIRFVRRLADCEEGSLSTDDVLLDRFVRTQDEWAFEQILERYAPLVLGVCRRQLRDPHLVDDAFQATFLVFFRKAKLVRSASRLGSWLHSVAYRIALKARNGATKRQARETVVEDLPERDDKDKSRRDLREVIDEELMKLPDYYRMPLVLCYLEGKTNAQAAEMLGCPEGTIFGRLNRGREKLRERLARRGLAPTSAVLAALLAGEMAEAAVPATLLQATLSVSRATSKGSSSVHVLADAVGRELTRRRLAIYAVAALTILAGVIVARPAANDKQGEIYPRRLLAVRVDHHLFAAPIEKGKTDVDTRQLIDDLGAAWHIDPAQRQLLAEDSPTRGPVTRARMERAIAGYLRAARPQDRVVLLIAAHAVEIKGHVYLMPFEGNPHDPSTLLSWTWLQTRLRECTAQQKVVILDVARVHPENTSTRVPMSRLSKLAADELQTVPEGVQLWLSCGQGECSLAGDFLGGSLFLEELDKALPSNVAPPQLSGDPLPVEKLAEAVNAAVNTRARKQLDRRQTPQLIGQPAHLDVPALKEALIPYELPRDRPGDVANSLLQVAGVLDRAHRLLAERVEEHSLIRRSQKMQPGKVLDMNEEVASAIQEVQVELAALHLEMYEKLDLLENIVEAVSPEWAASWSYTRLHLMALTVRVFEYNYRLSDLRKEGMPDLEPEHQGWMLVNVERINARGSEGRDAKNLYDKSQMMLLMLEASHERVPWRRLALRDGIVHVGLVWQPFPARQD